MAKVKQKHGRTRFAFVKELGGAVHCAGLSKTARVLIAKKLIRGRVLDYGCGFGDDAAQLGWDAFDPYYRHVQLAGPYDTIVVNHVANMLTHVSREVLFHRVNELLAPDGVAYISVSRNIPVRGKAAPRQRIQNYVVLTLASVYADDEEEIYRLPAGAAFRDCTQELENR